MWKGQKSNSIQRGTELPNSVPTALLGWLIFKPLTSMWIFFFHSKLRVVAHTFNLVLRRQRQVNLCQFKANLVYKETAQDSRAT